MRKLAAMPRTKTQLFRDVKIEPPADMPAGLSSSKILTASRAQHPSTSSQAYSKVEWGAAKTKIFDRPGPERLCTGGAEQHKFATGLHCF